jgi:hypothetical protein
LSRLWVKELRFLMQEKVYLNDNSAQMQTEEIQTLLEELEERNVEIQREIEIMAAIMAK